MKKMSVAVLALSLTVSTFGIANAGYRNGMGMGQGYGTCPQGGVPSELFRKFQSNTIDLRQEMMTKRFEMQRENLKASPDKEKIAALQADIKTLQSKIMEVRNQSGLQVNKCDGECSPRMGGHNHRNMGGFGKGMGGCNNPCVQK